MEFALDRFSWQLSRESRISKAIMTDLQEERPCTICGVPAHYKLHGMIDQYCRPCAREVAQDMGMNPGEDVELIP